MVIRGKNLFLFVIFLVFFIFLVVFSSFVSAEFNNCWVYSNTNSSACTAGGCIWKTQATDPWCTNAGGCCMDLNCGMYSGNQAACTNSSDSLNCTWDPYMSSWYPNGTQGPSGGCMMNWSSGGSGGSWGGVSTGCWQHDGNKATCSAQSSTCKWTANDQNQDPACYIKNLADAQNKNPSATATDIGCCLTTGCWNNDNNETACKAGFQGSCYYTNNSFGGGWCNTKSCSEIIGQENCTYVKQNLMMPCNWTGSACSGEMYGSGGFGFYNNSDSCFSAGGWYNSTGSCVMPTGSFGSGSGGFMFGGEAHCWFADNQPLVCGNITGCAYCVAGTGNFGISSGNASSVCSGKQVGFCEGHNSADVKTFLNANNSANLACTHIQVKSACTYGPLPNCKWSNSTTTIGAYCEAGASSEKKSAPPAQYCEDPKSKNNYTICMQLANDFMMPCKWQNTTYPIQNCTFNDKAVFGSSGGENDFGLINSQLSCTSAGGTWNTEYYVDEAILKQDAWCEMTGMFDVDNNKGTNNKANCDTSCWACEFQNNGTAWPNAASAEAACTGSALAYCSWTNDSSSFNKLGRCDFPKQMENGGAKDCNIECEGCNFMTNPQTACEKSMANDGEGCKWVSEGSSNYCVDKTKKVCSTDCFSCKDVTSCQNSSLACSWDSTFSLCKPDGYSGEICFNGVDDDSDGLIDCADPDCGFDNFCGGSSFGGNCFAKTTKATCNVTVAFGGLNCTWLNDTWNTNGWCDMPGANCWKYQDNLVSCGQQPGCTNVSTSMGSNSFCDVNMTKSNNANCWNKNYSTCSAASDCSWKNDTWCANNPTDTWCASNPNAGWCDYKPMAACNNLNSTACSANANCTWQVDQYSMVGGWCGVACMNKSLDETSCGAVGGGSLCEWRNMGATCQPSTFMFMGASGSGGMGGCPQYNGNQTGCLGKNITCTYKNDSYANNNVSATEPKGWCMDKAEFGQFGSMEGNIVQLAMDSGNINGSAEAGVTSSVDILGMGMRVTGESFNFGAGIFNISDSIICNGQMVGGGPGKGMPVQGVGNKTGKFYWYLDTNGNSSDGCFAVPVSGANLTGYDFMISYVSRNTSAGIVETKQLMRCANGVWSSTNALITISKKISCGEISGVMVGLAKQDIESFAEYNETVNMKIFMTSANEAGSRLSPSDSVGPGYYTPGTIDFGFTDCSDPVMAKDPKCKNFQKFGFNVFEECKNGIDDDENGLVDCDDPFCSFMPNCAGSNAFSFVVNVNDKTAPVVMFNNVEKLFDGAFVKIDTNEPSNLSLDFFGNDSACTNLNITLNDTSSGYQANANFKPFHSVDLIVDTLGYALINNTAYYYKIKVCDPSSNCALSACSNFTTKATALDKSFIFKIELPDNYTVDIPAFNKTNYNFTENFGGTLYEVGIKTNTSVTKSMNMTLHCGDMAIGFYGMNVLDPTKIDLSNAFICNQSTDLIGMNSSLKKWNKLIDDLHLGGASDYVEITLPIAYSISNTFNWTDDTGANGQNVSSYVNCSGNSSHTDCKVPVSMGFSAYKLSVPLSTTATSTTSGGGAAIASGGSTYTVSESDFVNGYNKNMATKDKLKFNVSKESHIFELTSLTLTSATIKITSSPQTATLAIGETKKFDLTGDNIYDVSVVLNKISLVNGSASRANITLKADSSAVIASESGSPITGGVVNNQGSAGVGDTGEENKEKGNSLWIVWMIIGLIAIVVVFVFYSKHKRNKRYMQFGF